MKTCFLILTLWVQLVPNQGFSQKDLNEDKLRQQLLVHKNGIPRVKALVNLSQHYIRKSGEHKEDLDKAMDFAEQAKKLSVQLKYQPGYNDAQIAIATDYIERGDRGSALKVLQQMDDSTKIDLNIILCIYHRFGGQINRHLDSAIYFANQARSLSKKINRPDKEVQAIINAIYSHQMNNEVQKMITLYDELHRLSQKTAVPDMHVFLSHLSLNHLSNGNYNLALYYSLEAIKDMHTTGNRTSAVDVYNNMAHVCRSTGQFEKCIENLELAIIELKKDRRTSEIWDARQRVSDAWLKLKKPETAIQLIKQTAQEFPPSNNEEKKIMFNAFGNAYKNTGQYAVAEKYLLQAFALSEQNAEKELTQYRDIAQFYVETNQFEKAGAYLRPLTPYIKDFTLGGQAHVYYLLYKTDSAAGNYLNALNHLKQNKMLDDSTWQETKTRHLREIQIQYETEKKDQALKLKEQDILLLSSRAKLQQKDLEQTRLQLQLESLSKEKSLELARSEANQKDKDLLLQQQNIAILKNEALLKQTSLENANIGRNLTLAGIFFLLIIMGLLYNQYRIKQRNNRDTHLKNLSLEKLVEEKELLLKEVHHRVKNNLHTIISLLETQSTYLKDDALAAVQNSQHRVYAMSLIHQKLYQHENSTSINMAVYLPELLSYLRDSFDNGQRIRFNKNIEDIHLDISQAIPAGLILNEAITNCFKYAFPSALAGVIEIEMINITDQRVRFTVADNGIGMPENWEKTHKNSLGVKLMKGLSDDIRGNFRIENKNGTRITLDFERRLFSQTTTRVVQRKTNHTYA